MSRNVGSFWLVTLKVPPPVGNATGKDFHPAGPSSAIAVTAVWLAAYVAIAFMA